MTSITCSYPEPVNTNPYRRGLDPYDCRETVDAPPTYHAHGFNTVPPSQGVRRSSEPIVNGQNHCIACDDGANRGEWAYHHATHSYQAVETSPIKQHEYAAEVQACFTDASINNTRTFTGSSYAPPQYNPPAYIESVASWNAQYYETEPYYDQQASLESPMEQSSEQANYDHGHQLTSSSLHHAVHDYLIDDQPQRVNQAHVASASTTSVQYHLPHTASSIHPNVDVTVSSSLRHPRNPAPPVPMAVYDHTGSTDMTRFVVHSERPPLSSYSEFSAHTRYYTNILTSTSPSSSTMPSRPCTKSSDATGQSQPQSVNPAANAWKVPNTSVPPPTSSAGPDSMNTNVNTPPQAPPLQTWIPLPPSSDSSKSSHRSNNSTASTTCQSIKTEPKEGSPCDLQQSPRSKRKSGSPVRGMTASRSASSESRRSRTLSPSSRSQGVLKTIMMKRGGSEPKKQNLACLFCRERKIACGQPAEGSLDPTCNQCARRSLVCQYPTESRRGQHKRSKKNNQDHGHCVSRSK